MKESSCHEELDNCKSWIPFLTLTNSLYGFWEAIFPAPRTKCGDWLF